MLTSPHRRPRYAGLFFARSPLARLLSRNKLSGTLSFVKDAGDALTSLYLFGNEFDPRVSASALALRSDTRNSPLIVDLRGIIFSCPFPSEAAIRGASPHGKSSLLLLRDPCVSDYKKFVLIYFFPILGGAAALFGCYKFLNPFFCGVNAGPPSQAETGTDSAPSQSSINWLKVYRIVFFGFLMYDFINDIIVYKYMLVAVDYSEFQVGGCSGL
jgi:hypothetical protein